MKIRSVEALKCSFCGKSQAQVKKFIAGPGVYICNECLDLCNELMEDEVPSWHWPRTTAPGPDPPN